MTKLFLSISKLALGVGLASLVFVSGAFADSFTVYVGYADNLRPSGFFPTPWLGASNVVSETPAGQSLDTGAVMIVNTGATTLNITGFTVTLGTGQVFNIWAPLSIAPGQDGIFTQTASYNFDSSDYGVFGSYPPANLAPLNYGGDGDLSGIGGCSSAPSLLSPSEAITCAGATPIITFSDNSNPFTFKDTGHIIDTGGYDFIDASVYGSDGNESINWNVVGRSAVRGGTGTPEPGYVAALGVGFAGFIFAIRRRRAGRNS